MKILSKIKKIGFGIVTGAGAFTANYTFSDIADITGNLIGKAGIETGDFTSLAVLLGAVFVFAAFMGRMRNN